MADTLYYQKDRTRQENIWRECTKKERELFQLQKDFHMNLMRPTADLLQMKFSHNRIEMVTEKEIKQSPQERQSAPELGASYELSMIEHSRRRPFERFSMPQSSTHDLGWLLVRPMKADE